MATCQELGAALQRLDVWVWILFLLGALLFTAAGLRDGDVLITAGSLLFLVASALPLVAQRRRSARRGGGTARARPALDR